MNNREIMAKGVIWASVSQLVTQALHFISLIILARLLSPTEFGLMGMAILLISLITTINNLGLGAAIIQKKDLDHGQLSSVFWLNFVFGFFLAGVVIVLRPLIVAFFRYPELYPMLGVISFSFILNFGIVQNSLLQKNLEFKKLAFAEIGAELLYGITAVVLALLGKGVWALVFGLLVRTAALSLLLWMVGGWFPLFYFSFSKIRKLFGFSFNVLGNSLVNFFSNNIDYILIGRFLSAEPLGFYTLAFQLMVFPQQKISSIITRVTFPLFSRLQNENERLKKGYLKTISFVALIIFPALFGLFAVSSNFIMVVYGERWLLAIVPLQIMCFAGMIKSLTPVLGNVLLAKGRSDINFKWNSARVVLTVIAVYYGVRFGINGVAVAVTAVTFLTQPFLQKIANKSIGLHFKEYMRSLSGPFFASVIMSFLVYFLNNFLLISINPVINLSISILFGIGIYYVLLLLFRVDEFFELLFLLKSLIKNKLKER